MFASGLASAKMHCIVENIFQEGQWAILEWRDPGGLKGCGFFHVVDGQIIFQRGYWDRLSFLRLHGLALPKQLLGGGRSTSPLGIRRMAWSPAQFST